MLKILAVVAFAALPTVAIAADAKQEALNAVAFRLALAYHCIPVTGDRDAYEKAKVTLPAILAKAGVTKPTFAELVDAVETQKQEPGKGITKQFCNGILALPIALKN